MYHCFRVETSIVAHVLFNHSFKVFTASSARLFDSGYPADDFWFLMLNLPFSTKLFEGPTFEQGSNIHRHWVWLLLGSSSPSSHSSFCWDGLLISHFLHWFYVCTMHCKVPSGHREYFSTFFKPYKLFPLDCLQESPVSIDSESVIQIKIGALLVGVFRC